LKNWVLYIVLFIGIPVFAQNQNDANKDNIGLTVKKVSAFVCAITEVNFTRLNTSNSSGFAVGARFNDKFLIGIYGVGLMTGLKASDFNSIKPIADYNVSFSQGGFLISFQSKSIKNISFFNTLKIGYGSLFLQSPYFDLDYKLARDEILILTPGFDTEIFITDWVKLNFGVGVRFISGLSGKFTDVKNHKILYYQHSALDGANISISLIFGSF
jgi:hypothetical protein